MHGLIHDCFVQLHSGVGGIAGARAVWIVGVGVLGRMLNYPEEGSSFDLVLRLSFFMFLLYERELLSVVKFDSLGYRALSCFEHSKVICCSFLTFSLSWLSLLLSLGTSSVKWWTETYGFRGLGGISRHSLVVKEFSESWLGSYRPKYLIIHV